jgi:hypothetical protein
MVLQFAFRNFSLAKQKFYIHPSQSEIKNPKFSLAVVSTNSSNKALFLYSLNHQQFHRGLLVEGKY